MKTIGRDHYAEKYASDLDIQAKWLRFGAEFKADSVESLCRKVKFSPSSIIEVGAGTGAVISEVRRRGLGKEFTAIDYSAEALSYLKKADPKIEILQGDVTTMQVNLKCDLLICTHVLEHLEAPQRALEGICRNIHADYYMFEVPLEDLPLGRLRNSGGYRIQNPAGHVQFYSRDSFRKQISRNFDICEERVYFPVFTDEAFEFTMRKSSKTKRYAKYLTQRLGPALFGALWTKFWYSHMAVLAKRHIRTT
jgi:hypothetical protein